jgi:antitoxin ParD1/3/4
MVYKMQLFMDCLSACINSCKFAIMVGIIHTMCMKGIPMTNAEKISIALPPEMVHIVRAAVATGEYASSSEVIRDALRDWTHKRSLRMQGIAELRGVWQEALNDKTPGISADDVLDRLERKYQAIAGAADAGK